MKYLWTEDKGAGLHFWNLANQYLFENSLIVETKYSNQGLLDSVRSLVPNKDDIYYIAFDLVYDNVDVVNKFMDLQEAANKYSEQIIILDMLCFEYIILAFNNLIEWTKSGRKDKIEMRQDILQAVENHRINIDKIRNQKTCNYLMGFRRYSTEKVIKSITYELTDGKKWSVKGDKMGECWYKDCCVLPTPKEKCCNLPLTDGDDKFKGLLNDSETQRIVACIITKPSN